MRYCSAICDVTKKLCGIALLSQMEDGQTPESAWNVDRDVFRWGNPSKQHRNYEPWHIINNYCRSSIGLSAVPSASPQGTRPSSLSSYTRCGPSPLPSSSCVVDGAAGPEHQQSQQSRFLRCVVSLPCLPTAVFCQSCTFPPFFLH